MQSWISVYDGSKGGGRKASLRSRQHYTQVPEGVAPTHLSLPLTCIHQMQPGSGCHQHSSSTPTSMAWPCPGYRCLMPFSFFLTPFFFHHGRSVAVLFFHGKKASLSFPRLTHSHTKKSYIPFYLLIFFRSFHFHFFFSLSHLQSKYKSTETQQHY